MGPYNEQWKSREVARLLALVETERRYYQEMVANLPISVAVINQQGSLVHANRAFRQVYNVSNEELRKLPIQQFIPSAELTARIQSVFESGLGSRPLVIDQTVSEGATQTVRKLRVSVQAIRDWDEDSGIQAMVVVEDLAAEATSAAVSLMPVPVVAAAEAAALPALPDPLPCVIWTARSADRAFTEVSPSARVLLDINPEEWIHAADSFSSRILEADRDRTLTFYSRALNSPGLHSSEFRMRRPGVWYRETILVSENSTTVTGVITDVTARRALEEQILQSQRFEAMTQLAGKLAHDVNNPLMIVNGYAEDLAGAFPANDPRAADMREIQLAGKRIGELTGHLQAVTRKQLVNLVPVDINADLKRVVERMRSAAGEYLQADHAASEKDLTVLADSGQLDAILLELSAVLVEGGGETAHLVLSARPYVATETVRTDQPLGSGDFVRISIVNQSHAAPALNARLFETLLPGKEPGREPGPTLARAYKTIQDWGGWILAIPDNSEICVYLKSTTLAPAQTRIPATANVPPGPGPMVSRGPAPTATPVPPAAAKSVQFARKTSILIVEDEPGIRALMRKILQREGFEVFEAGTGTEALALFKDKGPFNLLITDIVMPGMSGLNLATQVRQTDPNCGILYMSGFSAETGVETGQFPPGSHFLQKPFTLGSLLRKANEVLAAGASPKR